MNPRRIKIHKNAYILKAKMIDEQAWHICGNYVMPAVMVAVERCLAGKKARLKYVDSPILKDMKTESKAEKTEEEKAEMENYKLAMSLKIMQANFELNKES